MSDNKLDNQKTNFIVDKNDDHAVSNEKNISWLKSFIMMVRDPKASKFKKLLAIASIVYIISPIDLIPEIPTGLFGLLDDLAVLIPTISAILYNINKYRNKM